MSEPTNPPLDAATLLHRFDEWEKSTEFSRATTRPIDAGEQMALRDAHELLVDVLGALRDAEAEAAAPRPVAAQCVCGHPQHRHQMGNLGTYVHCADCGCKQYQPPPPAERLDAATLRAELHEARQWITDYLNTCDAKGLPSAEARLRRIVNILAEAATPRPVAVQESGEIEQVTLTPAEAAYVLDTLANPPEPSEALRKAFAQPTPPPPPAEAREGDLFCWGGCGRIYGGAEFPDVHLPTALWNRIAVGPPFDESWDASREGRGGVLCPMCIITRLATLPDCTGISATINGVPMESGTLADDLAVRLTSRLRVAVDAAVRGALKGFVTSHGSSIEGDLLTSAAKRAGGAVWGLLKTHPDVHRADTKGAWPSAIAEARAECAEKAERIAALTAQVQAREAELQSIGETFGAKPPSTPQDRLDAIRLHLAQEDEAFREADARVRALQGGCGCIYGGPGIGLDTECAVHRQARETLEAQVQALELERDNALYVAKLKAGVCYVECPAYKIQNEQSGKLMVALLDAYREKRDLWQQAIAVVEQHPFTLIGVEAWFNAHDLLAALRAKSEGK